MSATNSAPSPTSSIEVLELIHSLQYGCHQRNLIPQVRNLYGYQPSLAAGIIFTILFGILLFGHSRQAIWHRRWNSIFLTIATLIEVLGWSGRIWSAECPYNHNSFLMQITSLIIAPNFVAASLYITLGQLTQLFECPSKILSAKIYALVFCSFDVISLVIQAAGGGWASAEEWKLNGDVDSGRVVMIAGIAFQLLTMTCFGVLGTNFLRQFWHRDGSRSYRTFVVVMVASFSMVYIRCIYRTAELSQGWGGFLIANEGFFVGLDAATMAIAIGLFLVCDPAVTLPRHDNFEKSMESGGFSFKGQTPSTQGSDSLKIPQDNITSGYGPHETFRFRELSYNDVVQGSRTKASYNSMAQEQAEKS